MNSTRRIILVIAGLALAAALTGPSAAAAPGGPLTIESPAFANGAPIPVWYTCKGTDTAPPLNWSAPLGGALVVDDPDAPDGTYVHWIVIGIAPGAGQMGDGGTPGGGVTLPNSAGQAVYNGPCPPPGSGVHHYRFTLYQLPNDYQLPSGLAGLQAAQTIAGAANAQAQLVGVFGS